MYPYNYKRGQTIRSDSTVPMDRAFIAHYNIPAADAVAASTVGVLPFTAMGAEALALTSGFNDPAVPRFLQIDGNVAGITGDVVIVGKNFAGEAISDTIALNGTTAVAGVKAYASIDSITLPAKVHTAAYQTETIEVTAAVTSDGNITMTITSALLAEPKAVVIALTDALDDVTKVAAAIVDALNADEDVSAHFLASNEAGVITLTALEYAANDATLAFGYVDTDTTGVTCGSSTNGTAGVAEDKVSVGWTNTFGLPYKLTADELVILKLFNNAADTGTVTPDADDLEKNVIALNGTPDGLKPIDLYFIV